MTTVSEAFDAVAARQPDAVALVDGDMRLSYAQLAALRDEIARDFKTSFGLAAGDRVGLCLPNGWEFVAGFLALVKLAAVSVPLPPNSRGREIISYIRMLGPRTVVAPGELRQRWTEAGLAAEQFIPGEALPCPLPSGGCPLEPGGSGSQEQRDGETIAALLLTSGSSGTPKIVPRSHRNLLCGAANVGQALGPLRGRRFLGVVPFFHANGFANNMLLPIVHGGELFIVRRFLPAKVLELMAQHQIQVLVGSPFLFRSLAELPSRPPDALSAIQICLSSGGPMSPELTQLCLERLGIRVRQLYGSTETGTISIETADQPATCVTAGRPLPGVQIMVQPAGGSGHERSGIGEILVKSEAAMQGYWSRTGHEPVPLLNGYLRTGDLGRMDEQGNIELCGRLKRFINAYGVKIDPAQIEAVVRELPGVTDCAVSGVDSGDGSEIVRAVIGIQPGLHLERALIIEHCRRHLSEHKIPRIIEIMEGPLVNITGKRRATEPGSP